MKLENWIYSKQKREKSSDEIQLTVCKEGLQHTNIFRCICTHLYAPFLFFNLVDKLRVEGSSEITSNQEPRLQSTLTTRPVQHYPKLISPFLNCGHFKLPFSTFSFSLYNTKGKTPLSQKSGTGETCFIFILCTLMDKKYSIEFSLSLF